MLLKANLQRRENQKCCQVDINDHVKIVVSKHIAHMRQDNEDESRDVDSQYGPYQGSSKCQDDFDAWVTVGQLGRTDPVAVDKILGQGCWATVGQIARNKFNVVVIFAPELHRTNLGVKWISTHFIIAKKHYIKLCFNQLLVVSSFKEINCLRGSNI